MPARETLRDVVFGSLDQDLVRQRENEGWKLVAVEWQRESSASSDGLVDVPYGLRVAGDCRHLEEDPVESEILRVVMQGVVNDWPLSRISDDLNRRGLQTRSGDTWNPARVFQLMPALVNEGPRIFSEPDWTERRRAAQS